MTKINKQDILGIFDSGVGGFSVFKEVRKNTQADILYYGDCLRAPYGNRSEEEIVSFIKEILLDLKSKGVMYFISACNSMSVLTTEKVLSEVEVPRERYIDMVDAVGKIDFSSDAKVLIIGTQATITSGVYQQILSNKSVKYEVFVPSLLAGHIEQGDMEMIIHDVDEVLNYALRLDATSVLYACTHYPLVDEIFKERALLVAWSGSYVNPAKYVAEEIKKWNLGGEETSTFLTSLSTSIFEEYVERAKSNS
jgi:glutamate racemase